MCLFLLTLKLILSLLLRVTLPNKTTAIGITMMTSCCAEWLTQK